MVDEKKAAQKKPKVDALKAGDVGVNRDALDKLLIGLGRNRTKAMQGMAIISVIRDLFGVTHAEALEAYSVMNKRVEDRGKVAA